MMRGEVIGNELERVFIERDGARGAALTTVAGISSFGDAALQPELDVARKFTDRRVEFLPVESECFLVLRRIFGSQLTLADSQMPSLVGARRDKTAGTV